MPPRRAEATTSLTEAAVETIRDRILDLTLEAGSRIDEKVLMERFALSRTPAREALHRLVAEGLVQMEPKKGAYVRPLDVSHIRQLFDAYFVSERMNGFFCQTTDPGLVDDLKEIQAAYETAQERRRFLDMTRVNTRFHLRVASATHNEYLIDFSARLQNQARRLSYFVYLHEAARRAQLDRHQTRVRKDHLEIIDTVGEHDNARLVDVLTRHARLFHERIMRTVGAAAGADAPLPPQSDIRDSRNSLR